MSNRCSNSLFAVNINSLNTYLRAIITKRCHACTTKVVSKDFFRHLRPRWGQDLHDRRISPFFRVFCQNFLGNFCIRNISHFSVFYSLRIRCEKGFKCNSGYGLWQGSQEKSCSNIQPLSQTVLSLPSYPQRSNNTSPLYLLLAYSPGVYWQRGCVSRSWPLVEW